MNRQLKQTFLAIEQGLSFSTRPTVASNGTFIPCGGNQYAREWDGS